MSLFFLRPFSIFGMAFGLLVLVACETPGGEADTVRGTAAPVAESADSRAQRIVDAAIEAHGGERFVTSDIAFDFRGRHFWTRHEPDGSYRTERTYTDTLGRDVRETLVTGVDADRFIDGVHVTLSRRDSLILGEALNSVPYFALLPFRLNDTAVRKRYLGEATVEGEPYHKVEVTFEQQDGGRDWEDRFVYWFHRNRHTMDYVAYRYGDESDDTRLRKAVNTRTIGGIRFADYLNYAVDSLGLDVGTYDRLLEDGTVELYSEILHKNVTVEPRPDAPSD